MLSVLFIITCDSYTSVNIDRYMYNPFVSPSVFEKVPTWVILAKFGQLR